MLASRLGASGGSNVRRMSPILTRGQIARGIFEKQRGAAKRSKLPARKQTPSAWQQQQQLKHKIQQERVKKQKIAKSWGDSLIDNGPIPRFMYVRHDSTILQPQYSGKETWAGLLTLTGVNFAVLCMWNGENTDEEWMMENFTTDLTNFKEGRVYTLGTASISHQNLMHYGGNMFAMWLFGWNTYRVIGTAAFYGLYAVGGVFCSATHLFSNVVTGRTQPPLSEDERKQLEQLANELGSMEQLEQALPPHAKERLRYADKPSLGASGSVMAIASVAACLFPMDKMMFRNIQLPLPIAVGMFFMSDLSGLFQESATDHAGHLGGLLCGIAYVTTAWYSKKGSFRILHTMGTKGQIPIVYRYKQMFQQQGM
jgi:membrane associated rhomboid family serine protease